MGIGGRSPHNTKRDTCFHRAGHGVDAAHGGDLERLASYTRLRMTTARSAPDLVALVIRSAASCCRRC
jgi:hypothetical protein